MSLVRWPLGYMNSIIVSCEVEARAFQFNIPVAQDWHVVVANEIHEPRKHVIHAILFGRSYSDVDVVN